MNKAHFEQIDAYLLGKLQGDALQAFEEQLQIDQQLQKSVMQRRESLQVIDDLGDVELKKRLKTIHNQVIKEEVPASSEKTPRISGRLYRWIAIAACVLIIIAGVQRWLTHQTTPEELFTQHYEPYPLSFGSRSMSTNNSLREGSEYYRNGAYQEASLRFELVLQDTFIAKAQLALGIAALELEDYEKAMTQFDELIRQKDPIYEEQAIWYKALTYLKQNQLSQCRQQLQKLNQVRFTFRRTSANTLLRELTDK